MARVRERHGALGCGRAVVDGGGGWLLLVGLEGGYLGLLLADHVEETVDLALLLVLDLLVQLTQARCTLMVWAVRQTCSAA